MAGKPWKLCKPLDEALQVQLRSLIKELGHEGAAKRLEINAATVARAAAGAGLKGATILAIRAQLHALGMKLH